MKETYTYEQIVKMLPKEFTDRYYVDQVESINCLMIIYRDLDVRCSTTIPIGDIYEIAITETTTTFRSLKFSITVFNLINYINSQIF
jgi:hypothetical protein